KKALDDDDDGVNGIIAWIQGKKAFDDDDDDGVNGRIAWIQDNEIRIRCKVGLDCLAKEEVSSVMD
ncbi:hypothetical protein Tco_0844773, partial [Tanacetum coccineum]